MLRGSAQMKLFRSEVRRMLSNLIPPNSAGFPRSVRFSPELRDGPYWTSRHNSLVGTTRDIRLHKGTNGTTEKASHNFTGLYLSPSELNSDKGRFKIVKPTCQDEAQFFTPSIALYRH